MAVGRVVSCVIRFRTPLRNADRDGPGSKFVSPDSGVVKAFCEPEFPAHKFPSGIDPELIGHAIGRDSEKSVCQQNECSELLWSLDIAIVGVGRCR